MIPSQKTRVLVDTQIPWMLMRSVLSRLAREKSFDEWNDDGSSVGWHEGWEQMCDTSASSFSLGVLDVSATSSPKQFEWVKMNRDTGAAVNTFPLNFGPEGAGDGRFYRTASGEMDF